MGTRRSRSSKMVPYVCPFNTAQSSTPKTRGPRTGPRGVSRTRRKSVSGLQGMPRRAANRAPASPPKANPRERSISCKRRVRCLRGKAKRGTCSVNVRRGQAALAQKNRRVWSESRTWRPLAGRSRNIRRERLWMCVAEAPHAGQQAVGVSIRTTKVTTSAPMITCSTRSPGKSGRKAAASIEANPLSVDWLLS
jgi:hypothetical protein